jgi:TRAP-type C4-dicarboxylate transport system substrate-binding protein
MMAAVFMVSLLAMTFFGTSAFAQQKYVLKFNHVLGQKEPYHQGINTTSELVV